MSNTSDFTLAKEDHTMGNLISEHLKQERHVLMAGYKGKMATERQWLAVVANIYASAVAHPNVPEVMIRIQTDGSITPREAFKKVCGTLISNYSALGREFQKELALRQLADQGEQGNNANGQGHGGY
jgi:DNA-directed RNA polymerase II subunit RPB11